jgi:MFS-type transporter involved in bile tolerance (Atg22 family)
VYFLFAAMVIASGVISTICTADFLQIAAPEELGCFFGLLAALDSVAGILAGILAGACTAFLDATTATLLVTVSLNGLIFCMVLAGYERVVSQNLPRPIHNTKRLKQA